MRLRVVDCRGGAVSDRDSSIPKLGPLPQSRDPQPLPSTTTSRMTQSPTNYPSQPPSRSCDRLVRRSVNGSTHSLGSGQPQPSRPHRAISTNSAQAGSIPYFQPSSQSPAYLGQPAHHAGLDSRALSSPASYNNYTQPLQPQQQHSRANSYHQSSTVPFQRTPEQIRDAEEVSIHSLPHATDQAQRRPRADSDLSRATCILTSTFP